MRISSKKTKTKWWRKGRKTWFMRLWKVEGELHKPKGMTKKTHSGPHEFKRLYQECLPLSYISGDSLEWRSKFSKELGAPLNSSRRSSMTGMGNLYLMVSLLRAWKSGTHSPRTFFLQDHDYRRRVRACTRADNACSKEFLDHFLNFIFLWKGVAIQNGYWEEGFQIQGEWNDHEHCGRRESLGSGKYQFDV